MVLISGATGFLMNYSGLFLKFIFAMFIEIFGSILLVMFFSGSMTVGAIERLFHLSPDLMLP